MENIRKLEFPTFCHKFQKYEHFGGLDENTMKTWFLGNRIKAFKSEYALTKRGNNFVPNRNLKQIDIHNEKRKNNPQSNLN